MIAVAQDVFLLAATKIRAKAVPAVQGHNMQRAVYPDSDVLHVLFRQGSTHAYVIISFLLSKVHRGVRARDSGETSRCQQASPTPARYQPQSNRLHSAGLSHAAGLHRAAPGPGALP